MKQTIRNFLIISTISIIVSACGQKGPLILATPANGTTPASDTKVSEKDSILNTQTEEVSPSY